MSRRNNRISLMDMLNHATRTVDEQLKTIVGEEA